MRHKGQQQTSEATTTDASNTVLATIKLKQNSVRFVEVRVAARRTDAADRAIFFRRACVYREGAGAVIQGPVDSVLTRRSDASWTVTLVAVGDNLEVQVVGAIGKTINWKSRTRSKGVS